MLRTPHDRLSAGQIAETENEWFADRIVHGGALAMGSYQTGLAEDAEVLGGVGLLDQAEEIGPLDRREVELLLEAIGGPQAGAFARIYGLKNRLRAKNHMLSVNSVAIATGMPAASPPL